MYFPFAISNFTSHPPNAYSRALKRFSAGTFL